MDKHSGKHSQKKSQKLTKEDIKGPDAFVSTVDKAWGVINKHRRIWMVAIVVAVAGGAGFSLFTIYKSKKEASAQIEYYAAKKSLADIEKTFQTPPADPAAKKEEKPAVAKVKTGDLSQDFGSAVTALENVIQKHSGSKAAVLAALDLSPLFFEYKQSEKALNALKAATKSVSKSDLLYGFVYLQLGSAQQAAGKCDEAINSWKLVSDSKNHAFLHSEALLNEGLCHESLGQKDKATDLYRKVSQDFGDTDAGKSAKNYLRQINEKT